MYYTNHTSVLKLKHWDAAWLLIQVDALYLMVEGTSLVNSRVSQEACNSSISIAFIDEKNSFRKITITLIQSIRTNPIAFLMGNQEERYAGTEGLAQVFEKLVNRAQTKPT